MLINGGTMTMTAKTVNAANKNQSLVLLRRCCPSTIIVSRTTRSVDHVECTRPARVRKEVQNHVGHPGDAIPQPGLLVLIFGSNERPVVEKRASHDVCPRNESPVARIKAVVTIVAHHEKVPWRHHEISFMNILRHRNRPALRGAQIG